MAECAHPSELPRLIPREAENVYEALQEAENRCYRLAEMLDWQAVPGINWEPQGGIREVAKRRTKARRLHKRIFALLEAAEDVYHENGGDEA